MIAEIISVGTELLLGDIVDTNSAYLAGELTAVGYDIHHLISVGDNLERVTAVLKTALERADLIITTGGLGPTDDDLTREAVAGSTGRKLEENPCLVAGIERLFSHRGYHLTANNYRQAYLPEGASPVKNRLGTAPGILLETGEKMIISLPGVPEEMEVMFQEEVLPRLQTRTGKKISSRVLNFFSIGESSLETAVKDILEKQSNPTIAPLAGRGEVKLRITAKSESVSRNREMLAEMEQTIRERVGEYIYGIDDEELPAIVGRKLKERGLTLSLAESCTGGLIGDRITNIVGSSEYFSGGVISYSNQAKMELLGVKEETLQKYGAVSAETAREMAEGVRKKMHTELGLSATGIAGPGGGSPDKPVGLVYLGLADEKGTRTYQLNLRRDRLWNKWMSSQYACYYLLRYLRGNEVQED